MFRRSVFVLLLSLVLVLIMIFPAFADLATPSLAGSGVPFSGFSDFDWVVYNIRSSGVTEQLKLNSSDQYYVSNGSKAVFFDITGDDVVDTGSSGIIFLEGLDYTYVRNIVLDLRDSSGSVVRHSILPKDSFYNSNSSWEFPFSVMSGMRLRIIVYMNNPPAFYFEGYSVTQERVPYTVLNGLYVGSSTTKAKLYRVKQNSVLMAYRAFFTRSQRWAHSQVSLDLPSNVYFYGDNEYTVTFQLDGFPLIGRLFPRVGDTDMTGYSFSILGDKAVLKFTPPFDISASSVLFIAEHGLLDNACTRFRVLDIKGTYVPAGDTSGSQQQIVSGITVIKNVVTNISNTISNISNQITTSTTTITNTITNTANQIKDSVNQMGDKITQNQNQNTDKITQNQDKNTDKVTQNQDKNTDKVIENQNKNQDEMLNGYDSSKLDENSNKLNDTLTEYDDLESSISESMGQHFDDFEYETIDKYPFGILSSLLFFGNYLQSFFESIDSFNLPITLGLTLTFVLMLIGYFRYGR